ncbi:MAG: hypothetical protein HKP09_08905 [Enterobacterales bacterium]|nr:hypothetical protein [Enterobacterales bacterium]
MAQSLFEELKRRNVFKATTAYLVLAWVVIQVTAEAVPALGLPEWVNTLVFFLGALGLPFVILFSWAFELTPEGVKKEADVDRSQSIASNTGQKLNYVIILLLVVAIGLLLLDKKPSEIPATTVDNSATNAAISTKASIAVLPFVNMSNDAEQEFFSDGITEELLNVLAKISEFEVASRTSSFKFKGSQEQIPQIAQNLNVRYIVEGSVRKAGDTIRITAQLIDSTNDRHLWSDTFDRPLTVDNVFVIQDEISKSIVRALSTELGLTKAITVQATQTTDNLTAYELFLKARTILQSRTRFAEVESLLEEAIKQDPNYADAWALAAVNYTLTTYYVSDHALSSKELLAKSDDYAKKAISLDPDSANAYAVLGLNLSTSYISMGLVPWEEVFDNYEKAIKLNPNNPQALNWYAVATMTLGYLDRAFKLLNQCVAAEPFYSSCHANILWIHGALGDDKAAIKYYEDLLNIGGASIIGYAPIHSFARLDMAILFKYHATVSDGLGDWPYHAELYLAHRNIDKDHSALLAKALSFLDGKQFSNAVISNLKKRALLMPLGYFEINPLQFTWDPVYIKYRKSKQFKEFVKTTGILDYWQTAGFPKQCQPVGDDDFICD